MVVALVLARLLAPHDWGLAAMVLVFSGFVIVFTDSALGSALIQRRELRAEIVRRFSGRAPESASAHARRHCDWRARWRVSTTSRRFVRCSWPSRSGSSSVRSERLSRPCSYERCGFRPLELRQIAATLVGATTGITIAVAGCGAWAIVGQQLAEAAVVDA